MTTVNVHEAKTNFSHLIDRAHAGEEIIVAKAGKPHARIVPLAVVKKEPRKPGGLEGYVLPDSFWDPLPGEELDAWEGR